jgi:hypothetical protein
MRGNITTLKPIQKGDGRGGRVPGQTNITTRLMKRALILAAEQSVHSKDGTLVSYVTWIANEHPALFCSMIGRMVPMEAKIQTNGPPPRPLDMTMSLPEMISEFERKLHDPTYFAKPRTIEHDSDADDDDEFEQ